MRLASIVALSLLLLVGCKEVERAPTPFITLYTEIGGETMGTYYKIKCNCPDTKVLKERIEDRLRQINQAVSTYIPDSFISKVNRAKGGAEFAEMPDHFQMNLLRSFEYFNLSGGYFDVSTQPLVNYWGFGYTPKRAISHEDIRQISAIKSYVGLDKWIVEDGVLKKQHDDQKLGFAALAKGYAVDELGRVLAESGCTDYYVDIGGEQVMRGKSARGNEWIVGISTPKYDAEISDTEVIIKLTDKALASSGNYRNYHEVGGQKYGHTIDPKSGYPYQDSLLAVSIIAEECIDADAIATACMAMGYTKATTFIEKIPEVSACFLVGDSDGRIAKKFKNGFIQYVIEQGK